MSARATTKERILEALRSLPPDATVDDAIERLVFMARVEEGLAQLDAGQGIPHEEIKRRFGA
jgi:predicted transcriptional regulator